MCVKELYVSVGYFTDRIVGKLNLYYASREHQTRWKLSGFGEVKNQYTLNVAPPLHT